MLKKPIIGRLFFVFVIVLILFTILPISKANGQDELVRVGFFEIDGFNEISEDGKYKGYDYEYLKEISKYTDWKYKFVTGISYSEALKMLKNGELDIIGSVQKTDQREKDYFFPKLSAGKSFGVLSTRKEQNYSTFNNLNNFQNKTIGILEGSSRNNEIKQYMKKLNIYANYREYKSDEELTTALQNQKIDAIYTSNLRKTKNERAVLKLFPSDFYFIMNKNDTEGGKALNDALEKIEIEQPDFIRDLMEKYYADSASEQLILTEEEKAYLKTHKQLIVSVDENYAPMEAFNKTTGHLEGISGDFLNRISEETGIELKYVMYENFEESLKSLNHGKADIIPTIVDDVEYAEEKSLKLTSSYIDISTSAIVNEKVIDLENENIKCAVIKDYCATRLVKEKYEYKNFEEYNTMEECIKAVNNGDADITYIPTYSANYYTNSSYYDNINIVSEGKIKYSICLGISENVNPTMFRIINKAVNVIPESDINQMIIDNTIDTNNPTIRAYISKNPEVIVALVSLFWVIIGFVFFMYRRHSRKEKEESLLNEERMHIALEQTRVRLWNYDIKENVIYGRNKKSQIQGFQKDEKVNMERLISSGYIYIDDIEIYKDLYEDIIGGYKNASAIIRIRAINSDGTWLDKYNWCKVTFTTIFDNDNQPVQAVAVVEDINQRKTEERALKEQANKDHLTKLYNRQGFYCNMKSLENADGELDTGSLFTIDVDNFKLVNDTFGHDYGDEILIHMAQVLQRNFRTSDLIARYGGDEFLVYFLDFTNIERLRERAKKIKSEFETEHEGMEITCTIGISINPKDGCRFKELYKKSDKAMYTAKKDGRNRFEIYGD